MTESTGRPTVRPVTLARLVETVHLCLEQRCKTADVEQALNVSHRRARETILETLRIGLIQIAGEGDVPIYRSTTAGERLLEAVRAEDWQSVSEVLALHSPHYSAFLDAIGEVSPASLETILAKLEELEADTPRSYNQTSVEVVGDWGERLGSVQRNAFSGNYYLVEEEPRPADFGQSFLSVFDELEETAGIDLRQRYLSIPELREEFCERFSCRRGTFDDRLVALANANVGRLELSGAPMDTGAKDARFGIKEVSLGGTDALVSTTQSTERIMAGVEQLGKQYYYVAVHDRDLEAIPEGDTTA